MYKITLRMKLGLWLTKLVYKLFDLQTYDDYREDLASKIDDSWDRDPTPTKERAAFLLKEYESLFGVNDPKVGYFRIFIPGDTNQY